MHSEESRIDEPVDSMIKRARDELRENNLERALAAVNHALEADQDNRDALSLKQGICFSMGGFKGLVSYWTDRIRLRPQDPHLYGNRAHNYGFLKDFEAAIKDYDKAIGLDPSRADLVLRRSLVRRLSGDFEGADEDYQQWRWHTATPDEREAILLEEKIYGLHERAGACIEGGNVRGAIKAYSELLYFAADDVEARYRRGMHYRRIGEFEKAAEDLEIACLSMQEEIQAAEGYLVTTDTNSILMAFPGTDHGYIDSHYLLDDLASMPTVRERYDASGVAVFRLLKFCGSAIEEVDFACVKDDEPGRSTE